MDDLSFSDKIMMKRRKFRSVVEGFVKRIEEEMACRESDEVEFEREYLYVMLGGKYVDGGRLKRPFEACLGEAGFELAYDGEVMGFRKREGK
ncbi:MAG: hypothetical protein ACFFDF_01565 [Candidatus Odinarchaeota archaeon]